MSDRVVAHGAVGPGARYGPAGIQLGPRLEARGQVQRPEVVDEPAALGLAAEDDQPGRPLVAGAVERVVGPPCLGRSAQRCDCAPFHAVEQQFVHVVVSRVDVAAAEYDHRPPRRDVDGRDVHASPGRRPGCHQPMPCRGAEVKRPGILQRGHAGPAAVDYHPVVNRVVDGRVTSPGARGRAGRCERFPRVSSFRVERQGPDTAAAFGA